MVEKISLESDGYIGLEHRACGYVDIQLFFIP